MELAQVDAECGDLSIARSLEARGVAVVRGGRAPRLRVDVSRGAAGLRASFGFVDEGAPPRTIEAPTCGDLLDAVAFAVSVMLDAREIEEQRTTPAPEPRAEAPRGPTLGVGAALDARTGVAPDFALGVSAFGELAWNGRGRYWRPAIRVVAGALVPTSTMVRGQELRMALQVAGVELCPLAVARSRVSLAPCLRLRAGRIQAAGRGFAGARLANAPWADVGALLRASLRVAYGLEAEMEVGGAMALAPTTLDFGGLDGVAPARAAFQMGGGVVAHFP